MTSPEMLSVFFPTPQGDGLGADMLRRKLKKKHLKMRKCVFTLCLQAEIGGGKEQGLNFCVAAGNCMAREAG